MKQLSKGTLAYERRRLKDRMTDAVLRAFRESGLTVEQLAERLGRSPTQVKDWLGDPDRLTRIADLFAAFGVDLDDPTFTSIDELTREATSRAAVRATERG